MLPIGKKHFLNNVSRVPLRALPTIQRKRAASGSSLIGGSPHRGFGVASKEVLGVVVEVGLDSGNDTLAAYADGSVRYINQTGKLAVFDGGPPEVSAQAKELVRVSRATVDKIGPWEQPRREPPDRENIRLSFLVADGLYFGEGPYSLLRRDPMAADVIAAAERLLQLSVQAALAAT